MSYSKVLFLRVLAESIVAVGLTVGAALFLYRWLSLSNLAFLFLVAVIAMAGKRGQNAGLVTALLATLGFNFFFLPPAYTLHIADVDDLVTLLVFAITATLVSQFAARLKAQANRAESLAETSTRLSELTQDFAACADEAEIRALAELRIGEWTGSKVCILDPEPEGALAPLDAAAARWAIAHKVEAGRGTEAMAGADALYMPIEGGSLPMVVQLWRGSGDAPLPAGLRDLVRQAVARVGLAFHRSTVETRRMRDEMREAVLASVGHDLRTPLTGIMAGLNALTPDPGGIVETTRGEAVRLERLVSNVLDLARLRYDALSELREAIDLTDAVDAVLSSLSSRINAGRIKVQLPADLPLVRTDARMLHHMLLNLLDNAAKFSAPESPITVAAGEIAGAVSLAILDEGRGLPNSVSELPKRAVSEPVAGSGLGLTVVSGFAKVLGIAFHASNRADGKRGMQATLTFPASLCIQTEHGAP